MQCQPIRVEKIVAYLHISIEQNRHLVAPFRFKRRVAIDIDYLNDKGSRKTALHFLQGRNHVVAKVAVAT